MTYIKNTGNSSKIASGSYTGNSIINRAIAHGLGKTPLYVVVSCSSTNRYGYLALISATFRGVNNAADTMYTPTAKNTTNFYVGNATHYHGNKSGETYNWVAFG